MTPARRDDFRCVLLWGRWTPYHHARLRGLREALGSAGRVIPSNTALAAVTMAGCGNWRSRDWSPCAAPAARRASVCERCWAGMLPLLLREDLTWYLCRLLALVSGDGLAGADGGRTGRDDERKPRRDGQAGATARLARRMALRLFDAAFVGGAPQRRLHEAMAWTRAGSSQATTPWTTTSSRSMPAWRGRMRRPRARASACRRPTYSGPGA
jgi:hypothetical protein